MQSCYETVLDELKIPEIMLRPIEFLLFKSFLGALAKKKQTYFVMRLPSWCVFCSSLLITSSFADAELFTCVLFSASFMELSLRRPPQILWKASYRLMALHYPSILFSNFRWVLNGKTHSKGENSQDGVSAWGIIKISHTKNKQLNEQQ